MIKFHSVTYKNLLSFGNTPTTIYLDRSPSTLIQGKNGAGKSSALDAICFALFGKPFRKINKPHLVNHKNKKDLIAEIEFTVNDVRYVVRRGMNPQLFEIIREGQPIDQSAAVKDYQVYLEQNVLKFDYQSFTQLVILGKATYVSFMRLQAAERRKFIEAILGLTVFGAMNEVHKIKVSELKDQIKETSTDIQILKEKIVVRKQYIVDLEADAAQRHCEEIQRIETAVASKQAEVVELLNRQDELMQDRVHFDESVSETLQTKLEKLYEFKSKCSAKVSQMTSDLRFFADNDECPTCHQTISSELKDAQSQVIRSRIEPLQEALTRLQIDVNNVSDEIAKVAAILSRNEEVMKEFKQIQQVISRLSSEISSLEESKNLCSPNHDKIEIERASLSELETAYDSLLTVKAELLEKFDYYDLISSMLKDTGIKSMVIRRYIPIINTTINQYLKHLGFFVKFVMDENFDEKIFSRGIDELSYGNFSEGEKLRIDLAILMAWRDIAKVQSNMATNLLIFDEVLDSSLDASGCESLMDVLQKHTNHDMNLFVVSHAPDKWADKFRSSMLFDRSGGFSKLVV